MSIKIIKKASVLKISGFLLIIVLLLGISIGFEEVYVFKNISEKPCVIVDAGHGGTDAGASGADGTLEKDLNLDVSKHINELLKFMGYEVLMTRETDDSTDSGDRFIKKSDMLNRMKIIEKRKDAVYIGIHMNKFSQTQYWGAQIFYSKNHEKSEQLAKNIQESVVKLIQPDNDREIKKSPNDVFILKKASIPAVIVECGFLSNKKELELLKTEEYRGKMAYAISMGVLKYNKTDET